MISDSPLKVLLIEDDPDDVLLIEEMLEEAESVSFDLSHTGKIVDGLTLLDADTVDVVLLDLSLPDGQGLETFELVHRHTLDVPIVVLTGLDDEETAVQAMHAGAQDYLVKGRINGDLLVRAVRYAMERHQLLAEKMQRMEDELKLAEEIQNSFLPSIPPNVAGFELGGYLHASGRIGGDFYDFIAFPNQNVGVALGDATGKGIPGALLIAKAQGVLRAQAQDIDRLSDGITTLNQVLSVDNEAGRFVTLFYAIINITEKRLTYVNAGHSPGLLFQKNGMRQLESSGPPLGMFAEATYTQNEVSLYPDDLLMICSDGVSEAMNQKEAFFDEGPILETIQEHRAQSAADLARVICEASEKFEAGNQRTPDDKTVVVVKVDP